MSATYLESMFDIYVASYEMKAVGLLELCVYYGSESSELWLDSKEGGDPTTNWTDDLLLQGLCRSGLQHSSPPWHCYLTVAATYLRPFCAIITP